MGAAPLLLVALLLVTDTPAAAPPAPVTVAVLDLKARGVPDGLAGAVMDVVTEEVARQPRFKVMSRKEMESMLNQQAREQLLGCDSTSCLAEIAGALNAELLVAGEVGRLGDGFILGLQLINQRYGTVSNRVNVPWPGAESDLPAVARAASQMLVLELKERPGGRLEVVGAPSGATVYLDDKPVKGRQVDPLDVGVYRVRVAAPGHQDRTIPVVVESGKEARVNGALSAIPLYRRPWFWVLAAGWPVCLVPCCAVGLASVPTTLIVFATGGPPVTANGTGPDLEARP
jgi:TolB-like protein